MEYKYIMHKLQSQNLIINVLALNFSECNYVYYIALQARRSSAPADGVVLIILFVHLHAVITIRGLIFPNCEIQSTFFIP